MFSNWALCVLLLPVIASAYDISSIAEHCNDIYSFVGDAGLEAPTTIVNVTLVPADTSIGVSAFCSVEGHIPSNGGMTRFLAYLPASGRDWAGVLTTNGCGGSCGYIDLAGTQGFGTTLGVGRDLIKKGFVATHNDLGHDRTVYNDTSGTWNCFRNNRTNEYNWSFLSTHLTTVATKALVEFYYGTAATRSIFRGGSTGGRQAFMAAARYPHDYDGVIAGFGAINETAIGATWPTYMNTISSYPNGSRILTTDDLYALHDGALASCDGNDGVVDGVIDPTYACAFDPIQILCSNVTLETKGSCLDSMDKVNAARGVYGYPSNSFSDKLIYARMVPGSELQWSGYITSPISVSFPLNAAFQVDPPLNWTNDDWDWDTDPYRLGFMEDIYTADFTSFRIFREKGGKILSYQGWADGVVAPGFNLHPYQRTIDELGSQTTHDFHRLFMYPGMAHSDSSVTINGSVGWRVDYYDIMNEWLDTKVAPEKLVVEHWNMTTGAHIDYRPYFSYPNTPRFVGGSCGNLSDPESWVGIIPPQAQRGADYLWEG